MIHSNIYKLISKTIGHTVHGGLGDIFPLSRDAKAPPANELCPNTDGDLEVLAQLLSLATITTTHPSSCLDSGEGTTVPLKVLVSVTSFPHLCPRSAY